MNSLNIKQMLIGIVVCFFCLQGYATSIDETNRYKKRVEGYRSMWESLMPTYTKLQYAGGMGLINSGFGWSYGKNNQWETDILFGIIPKYSSDNAKMTFTLKQNYIPWRKKLNDSFTFEPLECGLYFNTVFSDEFWTKEPDRYPKGYYNFSTRVRTHAFIGQRLRFNIPDKKRLFARSITAFYEISSCDLYIVSAFTNHLNPDDYLRLSFGLKFDIF
ncbi:MAG: hypothetical protein IJY60_05100 [Bacteroides sp.]|nr:hypothetical protein [Bacteroides sp.]MBQ8874669.1 hypothetical protein [Bacteroides sp.]